MSFAQKVYIVTGAASGIGRATALLLGQAGAKVGLIDLQAPIAVQNEIESLNGTATAIGCDVRSSQQVNDTIQQIVNKYGLLDGAANLAGVIGSGIQKAQNSGALIETTDEEWNRIIDVNLGGVKNCLRAELKHYNPKGCSIVNASSVSAHKGSPYNAAYSASKAAVVGLTISVAQEMGKHGVRINAISPGVTETAMVGSLNPDTRDRWTQSNVLGRMAKPEEIAKSVLYLLSDDSSFSTASVLSVDAGRG